MLNNSDLVLVVFDGDCPLCHWWVRRLLRVASGSNMWFVLAKSEAGAWLEERLGHEGLFGKSVVVLAAGAVLKEREAVCFLIRRLNGFWRPFHLLCFTPRFVVNLIYRLVASNRTRLSSYGHCRVAHPDLIQQLIVSEHDLDSIGFFIHPD